MVIANIVLNLAIATIIHGQDSQTSKLDNSAQRHEEGKTTQEFEVRKDPRSPDSQLIVQLPRDHPSYNQFIAKVVDVSSVVDSSIRDVTRTFLASVDGNIRIHTLHPGHKYSVAVVGRKGEASTPIKEEVIVMDPRAPQFNISDNDITTHNITLRAIKNEKFLQDLFLVEYRQLAPQKSYPVLEVLDIPDQKNLEVYLGNLNPGRDYSVQVMAVKSGHKSRPWHESISTKPSAVSNFGVIENGTCLNITFDVSPNSGADLFLIRCRQTETTNNVTVTLSSADRSVQLCDGIVPGATYSIGVVVKKGSSESVERTESYTVRPSRPRDFMVSPEISSGKYRLTFILSPNSKYDGCHVSVVSETLETVEDDGEVEEHLGNKSCAILLPLVPGERYEFTLFTFSSNTTSTKLHQSVVLTPAFNMTGFGLSLEESQNGVKLSWPQSNFFMSRLREMWNKVVGPNSQLEMRVFPTDGDGTIRRLHGDPYNGSALYVEGLTKGTCYKVQIFTVTKSGIISESRFNIFFRLSAPMVKISISNITQTSAAIHSTFTFPDESNPNCTLNVVVMDTNSHVIFDKTLKPQAKSISPISLYGLRPFHKYTVSSKISCSSGPSECSPSSRTLREVFFSTMQDKPGPVASLSIRPLNSYSAQLTWLPPSLPNGILTHYVVDIKSESSPKESRVLNVDIATHRTDHFLETVVDGLSGGEQYNITVYAATEAGVGEHPSAPLEPIRMPIMAPPHTSAVPVVIAESITSYSLSVSYSAAMFNEKHGKITRSILLVAEVTENGEVSETWMNAENITYTWMQVQRFDVWPLYAAAVDEVKRRGSPSLTQGLVLTDDSYCSAVSTEAVGIDQTCEDLPVDSVCNGPLKAATNYKFKLRLLTAPNLYTDTDFSDIVTTEVAARGALLKVAVLALAVAVLLGVLGIAFTSYWNRSKKARAAQASSKESQWAALKMIMAERAADCLAKLGLDGSMHNVELATQSTHLQPSFGHHRRCRSLRERTGVDHRLERLPSGPTQKTPLYTVIAGVNTNKRTIYPDSKLTEEQYAWRCLVDICLTIDNPFAVNYAFLNKTNDPRLWKKPIHVLALAAAAFIRPVKVCDFAEHVRMMAADSEFRFSEEYEILRNVGCTQSHTAAELPANKAKNRFTNILPYDHSRVRLVNHDDQDGADYVNANYMPGYSSRREFIAAQGPLPTTRDAFWQMAWEQDCPAIIALTKCVEKGRDKCHQYWPESELSNVVYADIEVTLLSEACFDEFIIRELRLKRLHESSLPRIIWHFHYMAWPDFGVPDHPQGIIRFVLMFRSRLPHSALNKPTIVHCSAGVGRSGTFIAIDRLLQAIQTGRPVDVFGIVHEMRFERCHMVQNEQQYIFIHHCILHAIASLGIERTTANTNEMHQNPVFEDDDTIAASDF